MTIAIRVELKEDWGGNCPAVLIMARTYGRHPATHQVGRITPLQPIADVCITREQDLYFEAEPYSLDVIEGRHTHEGFVAPTPGAPIRHEINRIEERG